MISPVAIAIPRVQRPTVAIGIPVVRTRAEFSAQYVSARDRFESSPRAVRANSVKPGNLRPSVRQPRWPLVAPGFNKFSRPAFTKPDLLKPYF